MFKNCKHSVVLRPEIYRFWKRPQHKEGILKVWKFVFLGISLTPGQGVAPQIVYIIKKVCFLNARPTHSFTHLYYTFFMLAYFGELSEFIGCSLNFHTHLAVLLERVQEVLSFHKAFAFCKYSIKVFPVYSSSVVKVF